MFCSPAVDKESFGLVLLEAMAAGKPTVASSIAGYAAVVSDGVDGLLVGPRDERALASAILKLLGDRSLRESMGGMGALKAKDYSWETVAQRVMSYYEDVLRGRKRVVNEEMACAEQGPTHLGAACQ